MKKKKLTEVTTISVTNKDRKEIRKLANDYDCNQYELISALIKIVKQFKPELKDIIKGGKNK